HTIERWRRLERANLTPGLFRPSRALEWAPLTDRGPTGRRGPARGATPGPRKSRAPVDPHPRLCTLNGCRRHKPAMPQSLAKISIHLICSTKNRDPLLRDEIRPDLHAYLGGILRDLDCPALEINTQPDHAHVLFLLSRTHSLSDVVGQLKRGSSAWLKTRD